MGNALEIELKDSTNLVIAITGFANKLMVPVPVFMKAAGLERCSRIVLHDPAKTMFLAGVPGFFDSFDHMLEVLKAQIARIAPQRLLLVGTSGGGHTAMLLAHALKANACVVFAPYPYLSDAEFIRLNDPALQTFHEVLERVRRTPAEARKYFDVKDMLAQWNGVTGYFVHVSEGNEWDLKRANTLENLPHLSIIKHPGTLHAVVSQKFMRNNSLAHCFKPDPVGYFKQFYGLSKLRHFINKFA